MRDILIIAISVVLYAVSFVEFPRPYSPLKGKVIYDRFTSSETETRSPSLTIADIQPLETVEEKQETKKEYEPQSTTKAKRIEKQIAAQKRIKQIQHEQKIQAMVSEVPKSTPAPAPAPAAPEPSKSQILNYDSLHQIVSESNKSYFYQLQQESNDVIVRLISYTPYSDKGILKVKIENNSRSYFFYSSISVQGISTQVFGSQFAKSGGSSVLYLLLNNISTKSGLVLNVVEQGSKRTFKINFFIP